MIKRMSTCLAKPKHLAAENTKFTYRVDPRPRGYGLGKDGHSKALFGPENNDDDDIGFASNPSSKPSVRVPTNFNLHTPFVNGRNELATHEVEAMLPRHVTGRRRYLSHQILP
ncbi:hypothetical protein CSPX01_00173 [Colletotrichum filicis]|nr:hypothetical protein CSPX01_00173 [Colletotrichum filicis]